MKHLIAHIFTLVFATQVFAAELDDRFKAIGSMTANVGDQTYDMTIIYDREKEKSYVTQKMVASSYLTINSVGQVIAANGKPGKPMLQITLLEQSGQMKLLSAEMFDEQGYNAPLAMGADGGDGKLTEYSFENGQLKARVEGHFLRLANYMSEPAVADGAEPIAVDVSWSAEVEPLK